MPSRKPYWCVAELTGGKIYPISRAYEYVEEAEHRMNELLKKEKYRNKNLQVRKASYLVDPRKPLRRRKS
jgi:hypothetical protein